MKLIVNYRRIIPADVLFGGEIQKDEPTEYIPADWEFESIGLVVPPMSRTFTIIGHGGEVQSHGMMATDFARSRPETALDLFQGLALLESVRAGNKQSQRVLLQYLGRFLFFPNGPKITRKEGPNGPTLTGLFYITPQMDGGSFTAISGILYYGDGFSAVGTNCGFAVATA